jgi:hypothetical protein
MAEKIGLWMEFGERKSYLVNEKPNKMICE